LTAENRRGIPHLPAASEEATRCVAKRRGGQLRWKRISVPGRRQTATSELVCVRSPAFRFPNLPRDKLVTDPQRRDVLRSVDCSRTWCHLLRFRRTICQTTGTIRGAGRGFRSFGWLPRGSSLSHGRPLRAASRRGPLRCARQRVEVSTCSGPNIFEQVCGKSHPRTRGATDRSFVGESPWFSSGRRRRSGWRRVEAHSQLCRISRIAGAALSCLMEPVPSSGRRE